MNFNGHDRANLFNLQPLQHGQINSLYIHLNCPVKSYHVTFPEFGKMTHYARKRTFTVGFSPIIFFIGSGKLPNFSVVEKLYFFANPSMIA